MDKLSATETISGSVVSGMNLPIGNSKGSTSFPKTSCTKSEVILINTSFTDVAMSGLDFNVFRSKVLNSNWTTSFISGTLPPVKTNEYPAPVDTLWSRRSTGLKEGPSTTSEKFRNSNPLFISRTASISRGLLESVSKNATLNLSLDSTRFPARSWKDPLSIEM